MEPSVTQGDDEDDDEDEEFEHVLRTPEKTLYVDMSSENTIS